MASRKGCCTQRLSKLSPRLRHPHVASRRPQRLLICADCCTPRYFVSKTIPVCGRIETHNDGAEAHQTGAHLYKVYLYFLQPRQRRPISTFHREAQTQQCLIRRELLLRADGFEIFLRNPAHLHSRVVPEPLPAVSHVLDVVPCRGWLAVGTAEDEHTGCAVVVAGVLQAISGVRGGGVGRPAAELVDCVDCQ